MKRKSLIIDTLCVIFFSSILFTSCEKDDFSSYEDKNDIYLTTEQIQQKENLNSIALTVVNIADSREIFNEIHSAVNISLSTGLDEQYRFKDILYPAESIIPSLKSFTINFRTKFKNAIKTDKLKSSSSEDIESFILSEDVQIYWPYSEEWDGITEPVITFDPIADIDENIGFKRIIKSDGSIKIDTVIVNDDYAFDNPVWIINFCESEEAEINNAVKSAQLKSTSSIHQLSVGWVKNNKHHYDNIFHGGDEYKFCIIGGKITSMNTAETFEAIQTVNISRKDIRKKNWKKFYYELDDNWKVDAEDKELGRKFGLIEFDKNKTTRELKFEPKVTIDKVTVSVGSYTIKTESSEGWIKTDTYEDRDKMIKYQKTDMGNGLKDGYRIYGAGDVYWTLPIREF
jgi:hypothetical protein